MRKRHDFIFGTRKVSSSGTIISSLEGIPFNKEDFIQVSIRAI
ncbi:hypothetical protein BpHYR1_004554 [Brachionus plicatilis]|uniref:Uncharacterized protein n=1 Tax=Brachionus plicatilis TaxID=10195 RepID=A0A3M7P9X0_BRAPC|nr:hypothetical protein BpHYR1_004554 [Brachionus plicatilis]